MNSTKANAVYFVDGCVARRGLVAVAAYLQELADTDAEHTRGYTYNLDTGRWGHVELDHAIVSIAYRNEDATNVWKLLSRRGVVVTVRKSAVTEQRIPGAGTGPRSYGYVSKIRDIGGDFYVCGYRRQVYKSVNGGWSPIHQGIIAGRDAVGIGFAGIDGTSSSNVYAVGWKGEIFHFDGHSWTQIDSPTNVNLHGVRCVGSSTVYACGDSGVVVRGRGGLWESLTTPGFTENLWSVEVFNEIPYFAHLEGLLMLKGDLLVPVKTGLDPELDGYRLHANDGVLWSFGHDHIGYYDGATWRSAVCPDNGRP